MRCCERRLKLFRAARARKHKFEILEGLPVAEYLLGDPML
jgi:hypothetical protein